MYKHYIVTAKTDIGIKSLKVAATKDIRLPSVEKAVIEQFKDYFLSDSVEILSVESEMHMGVITV